jgi:hypothetical protein
MSLRHLRLDLRDRLAVGADEVHQLVAPIALLVRIDREDRLVARERIQRHHVPRPLQTRELDDRDDAKDPGHQQYRGEADEQLHPQ